MEETTTYDPRIHGRHSIRLAGYDYAAEGFYFVTICTQDRKRLFGRIRNGCMELHRFGYVTKRCLQEIPCHFNHVRADAYVVMPDHVHVIIQIRPHSRRGAACCAPTCERTFGDIRPGSLSVIIRAFKSAVTKRIHPFAPDMDVWQRNFHDRIIRDQEELEYYRTYIRENPKRWKEKCNGMTQERSLQRTLLRNIYFTLCLRSTIIC
jgi:putative transposase